MGVLRGRLVDLREAFAARKTHPEFLVDDCAADGRPREVRRGDPAWQALFAQHVSALQAKIRAIEYELPALEKRLEDWKPI